jgi:nucleoside-diphosphate-sugar epimerase
MQAYLAICGLGLRICKAHRDGMSKPALHVVLGAGQIGTLVAERLVARGHRVRQVRRSPGAPVAGAELKNGDVADQAFAAAACRDAAVVYHCVNPKYHTWIRDLEPLALGAIHAASAAGARLVVLDNLYPYEVVAGERISERSPIRPASRKGALRARIREHFLDAHARGALEVAIGRAGDFFGPGIVESWLGDRHWQRVLAGKPSECLGDPDQPHSYAFSHDVADGLVTLGARTEAVGREWILPHPDAQSHRALAAALGAPLGLDVRTSRMPLWLLRAIGVVSPMMRELPEMAYQWQAPFVVDDSAFRTTFGAAATPLPTAIQRTASWVRARYEVRSSAAPARSAGAARS